ncbi:DUF1963 domain-containing protein [Cohaesibacter gelatinilyticus]|uniref:DUF1963 domain-containing protein n=1 Tax=Cohaesibacter gelatinilyticus TaxID=372072 RepID=A0A285PHE3_9HYPH|nr:DUF1963 domain-containing protein [Cohaesibacter gelatinilyticus]SNZ21152.1 protein of unknown function [Cohaesibacter gelatinilyticus]
MFGRRSKKKSDGNAKTFLKNFIDHQEKTERMKETARAETRPIAVLKPQIPIGAGPSAGWFGGKTALPEKMPWPEQDGKKLVFVGQIDLAALPQDLWSGLGPRSGWLAIFLPAEGELKPTLLHFEGPLAEVATPLSRQFPNDASWTRCHDFKNPETFVLPKWPIVVERRSGNEQHEIGAPILAEDQQSGTLIDPAYHPFNEQTTSLLLDCLSETVIDMAKSIVRFPAMKKLRPEDAAWFERQKPIMLSTFVRFFEIEGQMRAERKICEHRINGYIKELQKLDCYDFEYSRTDGDGYCELVLRETKLLDPLPVRTSIEGWWSRYNASLTNHALTAYTSKSQALPKALQDRLEATWQKEAQQGMGVMGHAPVGHIYTPHGIESPNEILLELPTSKLTGWIWGDCYSLVLLIKRSDLKKGDFSSIMYDITN